jgi:hypothetical protein
MGWVFRESAGCFRSLLLCSCWDRMKACEVKKIWEELLTHVKSLYLPHLMHNSSCSIFARSVLAQIPNAELFYKNKGAIASLCFR